MDEFNDCCIMCKYSEESYEDIAGDNEVPEAILVRRCPFVDNAIVDDDFLCEKFEN